MKKINTILNINLLNINLLNDMPVNIVERLTSIAIKNRIHDGLIIEDGKITGAEVYKK